MILWRDERCVVVAKPSGIPTHRGWANDDSDDEPLLQQVRDAVSAYVYPVHRLDRGASGVVLFALDKVAAAAFQAAWDGAEKRYYAITRGHPPASVVIDHPVPKGESGPNRPETPRVDAVTDVTCLETFGRYALVDARPRTGRLHQIRRHLKHISCPLIGDVRYGKGDHNRIWRDQHGLHRLALHAHSLAVDHPSGGRLHVHCPLPADLEHALASARAAYGAAGS